MILLMVTLLSSDQICISTMIAIVIEACVWDSGSRFPTINYYQCDTKSKNRCCESPIHISYNTYYNWIDLKI